jgi:hypothetical protein
MKVYMDFILEVKISTCRQKKSKVFMNFPFPIYIPGYSLSSMLAGHRTNL